MPAKLNKNIIEYNYILLLFCALYFWFWTNANSNYSGAIIIIFQSLYVYLLYDTVNYIQHYGLKRKINALGKYEPISMQHSWNCFYKISNRMRFYLPIHSPHHIRRFSLHYLENCPRMPYSFSTMILLAWIPPLWYYIMNKKLEKYEQ